MQQTAQPWVFLRGLTRGSGHWGRFVGEFEVMVPDARVIALDMPGNGRRYAERSPCSIQAMVADYRMQLDRLGIARPYNVLAMSLGGMVAVQWAYQWPQELQRLVLVGTSMRPLNPFYERLRPDNYTALLKLLLRSSSPLHQEQEILRMTTRHPRTDVLADWVQCRTLNPVSAANALRQLVAAARFRLPASSPPQLYGGRSNILLLAGQADALVSAKCTQTLARLWNCPAALHPTAGHDVPLDDGPWVAEQVRL